MNRHARRASAKPRLEPEWKRWLAENLLLGAPPESIAAELVAKGCPPAIARAEIAEAQASPYFLAAGLVRARLAKRDWHLVSRPIMNAWPPTWRSRCVIACRPTHSSPNIMCRSARWC